MNGIEESVVNEKVASLVEGREGNLHGKVCLCT